ncbi:pilus assembly protein TadG-related protein [Streptomyces sp. NPDC051994]|uniref:pilus assembly protein TadG-related protein n=1 Tax=unclassified Streptomyces TaxID=2593676 RepID=UPI003448D018
MRQDRGQAFPIYVVMVAGLLFLAFAFFAVGQASATRNGAQGAADSAALAAAQRAREELGLRFPGVLTAPGGLDDIFKDEGFVAAARDEAVSFGAKNHADLLPGGWQPHPGRTGQFEFTVTVQTQYTVGRSVIPGTEQDHAKASATAVIELRCGLPPGSGGDNAPAPPPVTITCDGQDVPVDPLPKLEKIFTVKLVD